MKIAGIYKITNVITGKSYIGQSLDVKSRIRHHRCGLNKQSHPNPHLLASCRLHGVGAFVFQILFVSDNLPKEELVRLLNRKEAEFISVFDTFSNGYNLTTGGDGHIVSEETRRKNRESHKGLSPTPECRQLALEATKGKPLSQELKDRMSAVRKGRPLNYPVWNKGLSGYKVAPSSEEKKRKIGQAQLGSKNHNFGKTTPEEVKDKIRMANNGSQCYLAKLDETKVADIKRRLATGESGRVLANEYGVAPTQISCIRLGKTWRHVTIA